VLRLPEGELRIRLFVYKVTGSSRGRPDERRIEITSTYEKGLKRRTQYRDVVLGFDAQRNIFVGVDPQRIAEGGPTGNASSFFDQKGLSWPHRDRILIRQRVAKLFSRGIEFHAFLKASRLAEYVFNSDVIHGGIYRHTGAYSGRMATRSVPGTITVPADLASGDVLVLEGPFPTRRSPRVTADLLRASEEDDMEKLRRRRVTPEQLEELQRRLEENGRLGEEFALRYERRQLRRAGRKDLAARVRLVSLESVAEGYDLLSFTASGKKKLVEVKSTSGDSPIFEMSINEWRTCCENPARYYVYRVTKVRTGPKLRVLSNLPSLESEGKIVRTAAAWVVATAGGGDG
jgi:hypothetical protein